MRRKLHPRDMQPNLGRSWTQIYIQRLHVSQPRTVTMRGRLLNSARCAANERLQAAQRALRGSGAKRWSSSSTASRKWSTPLAKSLGEAVTVCSPIPMTRSRKKNQRIKSRLTWHSAADYRTDPSGGLHAAVLDLSGRRILHLVGPGS